MEKYNVQTGLYMVEGITRSTVQGGKARNCCGLFGEIACICMFFKMHTADYQPITKKEGAKAFLPHRGPS